jgi:predicted O-methyltransferase YrrM
MIEAMAKESAAGQGDIEGHKLLLAGLVVSLNAQTVVETGVREGTSTDALLAGLALTGGVLTSIDIKPTPYEPPAGSPWVFLQGDALVGLKAMLTAASGKCDLIMLDDWHSAAQVAAELEICKRLVSPNHVIVVHDAMWRNTQPRYNEMPLPVGDAFEGGGPFGAIKRLDPNEWEYMTVPAHNGLTLLRWKGTS